MKSNWETHSSIEDRELGKKEGGRRVREAAAATEKNLVKRKSNKAIGINLNMLMMTIYYLWRPVLFINLTRLQSPVTQTLIRWCYDGIL